MRQPEVFLGLILTLIATSVHTSSIYLACGGIGNLQITSENGILHATWSKLDNFDICYNQHKVEVFVNNILVKSSFTTLERIEILEDIEPCTLVKVEVTAIGDDYSSETLSEVFIPETGPVDDIDIENNIATWMTPKNFLHCTYEVKINNELKAWLNQEQSSYDFSSSELDHCTIHTITVTPIGYDLTKGQEKHERFQLDLDIPNIFFIQEKFVRGTHAVWTDLGESCEYSVKVNNELIYDRISAHDVIIDEMNTYDCKNYKIAVQAHGVAQSGEWKEFSYEHEPIFNFEGINADTVMAVMASRFLVSIHWELEPKFKYCDVVSYNIMCSANNGHYHTIFDVVDVNPFALEKCKVDSSTNTLDVVVQPIYHSTIGRRLTCSFGIDYATGTTYQHGCEYLQE